MGNMIFLFHFWSFCYEDHKGKMWGSQNAAFAWHLTNFSVCKEFCSPVQAQWWFWISACRHYASVSPFCGIMATKTHSSCGLAWCIFTRDENLGWIIFIEVWEQNKLGKCLKVSEWKHFQGKTFPLKKLEFEPSFFFFLMIFSLKDCTN